MSRLRFLVALVAVILIVVIVTLSRPQVAFLPGLWRGEKSFMDDAGLLDFYLYIAPGAKKGYLVMTDADERVVSNQPVEMRVRRRPFSPKLTAQFYFEEEVSIPSKVTLTVDINKGTMQISDKKEVYAFLVKDNEASLAANQEYLDDG